jgi:hypothetical protein
MDRVLRRQALHLHDDEAAGVVRRLCEREHVVV